MATLRQVAKDIGLSVSVVSRALNPKPDKNARISGETRRLVLESAHRLGFKRNRAAEFLKRGRSAAIGVFLPEIPDRLIADLMIGLSEAAGEKGFPVNFYFGMTPQSYVRFFENLRDFAHSGIITYPYFVREDKSFFTSVDSSVTAKVEEYRKNGGHVIVLNTLDVLDEVPVISIDDYYGGEIAAEHLINRNCKSFIASSEYPSRTKGFVETVKKNGKDCETFKITEFNKILPRQSKSEKPLPLGIFATTDHYAIDIMASLRRSPLILGRDVLLIGYDDLELTGYLDPPLTTVHQPFKEEGRLAVKKLINMIYGKTENSETILPRLVVRETA